MAMCSYQTLARYDCHYRARDLDDIRTKQRFTINRTRFHRKGINMLQNRRSLIEYLAQYNDEDEDVQSVQDQNLVGVTGTCDQSDWDVSPQSQITDWSAPSPAWSSTTTSSCHTNENYVRVGDIDVPKFMLEIPTSASRTTSSTANHQVRQSTYKQTGSSLVTKHFCDQSKISSEYQLLKGMLCQHNNDSIAISKLVKSSWQVLLNALQSHDDEIVNDSMGLLSTLANKDLIEPSSILHMLQHGLVFSLRDSHFRIGYAKVIELLLSLVRSAPASIPYLIELMSNSKILGEFEESISISTIDNVRKIVEFYYHITETMIAQLYQENASQKYQPLIPEILLITGVSKQTLESYSPLSTMMKCFTPKLIENTIVKCSARTSQKEEDMVNMALVLLANALKVVHINTASNEHTDWIVSILCAFRDSNLEKRLGVLCTGLARLVRSSESSDHCSQGIRVDCSASRTRELCQQFLEFYSQYYGSLSSSYAQLMSEIPATLGAGLCSVWDLDD